VQGGSNGDEEEALRTLSASVMKIRETIKPPAAVDRWRPDQSEDPPEVTKPPDP
jgi:hypothetical protein